MWDFILWNTLIASLLAIVLKTLSQCQFLRRRPALVSLAWLLVLVKLAIPACLAIPLWSTITSQNYFRSVDTIALESRVAQTASLESVASMADAFPRAGWDAELNVGEFASNKLIHATLAMPSSASQNVPGTHGQWLAGFRLGNLSLIPNYQTILLTI